MIQLFWNSKEIFIEGIFYTLLSSMLALIGSLIIGIFLAICLSSKNVFAKTCANIYVEFFRNIPLAVIVMFCYVVLPQVGIEMNGFFAGTIGLVVYTAAFISDIILTGIFAVPQGQVEAARSTGLSQGQTMMFIILPQAFKVVLPLLGNRFVSLIKDSAILAIVAGFDLMYQADMLASSTFETFKVYSIVAICYLLLTLPISRLMSYLEKKWRVGETI